MAKAQKIVSAACALLFTLSLAACGSKSKGTVNVNDVAFTDFSKDISADRIYDTIKKLSATDNARITGFEGEKTSADYIAKEFKDMGFTVEEQSFSIKAYKCSGTEVNITTPESKKLDSKALSYSKETPKDGITSEIAYAGMGSDEELDQAKVKGKIALIERGGDTFKNKTERAYSKGALGAIFYDPNVEKLIAATLLQPSDIPAVVILDSEGRKIKKTLDSGTTVKVTIKVENVKMVHLGI